MNNGAEATRAVVTVGEGRGFVIEGDLVVTAAHCLPTFPPCASFSYIDERTYAVLLGPLGEAPSVWAECLFVDPIADIAVLGTPDGQVLFNEAEQYDALIATSAPLKIADAPKQGEGWLLSLDRRWFACEILRSQTALGIASAAEAIMGGMSGSPIMSGDGKAIGVCVTGSNQPECGPHPALTLNLPGWLLS